MLNIQCVTEQIHEKQQNVVLTVVCVCVQVRISEEQQKPSPEEPVKTAKPAPAVRSVFSDIWQIKSFLSFTDINDREVQWFHLLTLELLILTHHTGSWTILISFLIFFFCLLFLQGTKSSWRGITADDLVFECSGWLAAWLKTTSGCSVADCVPSLSV